MQIVDVHAREILDSRGNPTVEVEITTASGAHGRAAVPSGASTGEHEALELRDGDPRRYGGKGVQKAVENVNRTLAPLLTGMSRARPDRHRPCPAGRRPHPDQIESRRQRPAGRIARCGTCRGPTTSACRSNRYVGGVNAHVLPVPMMNIINGGSHSDAPIAFQEFMIRPIGARTFPEAVRMGAEVFHALKKVLHKRGLSTAVGDEGGFAPALNGTEDAIETIIEAIRAAGYRAGRCDEQGDVSIAMDCASSEFYPRRSLRTTRRSKAKRAPAATPPSRSSISPHWWRSTRSIRSRDGMAENDWEGWEMLTARLGARCQLVGDDLFVTNVESAQGHRAPLRQLDSGEGQPDRHAHRDARRHRHGTARRLHGRHLAPLGRDRGHDDRRSGRSDQRRPDQDRFDVRVPTAWPNTTSCSASPRSWATRPSTESRNKPSRSGSAAVRRETPLCSSLQRGRFQFTRKHTAAQCGSAPMAITRSTPPPRPWRPPAPKCGCRSRSRRSLRASRYGRNRAARTSTSRPE